MIGKSVALLALAAVCAVSAVQPGCKTRYEMQMKWADQSNSGAYWECTRWGHSVRKSCPTGTLFSAPFQTCVPIKAWEEFPYYPPPTTVNDFEDQCTAFEDECVNPCDEPEDIVCIGGQVVNGQCVCPANWVLNANGVCAFKSSVQTCRSNEKWDALQMKCVCVDGFQLVNGQCLSQMAMVGVCDGAPANAYLPGTMDCNPIACTEQQYKEETLYPTRNPNTFWQCAHEAWIEEMPCSPGTCFDYAKQVCVVAADWVNYCN